MWVYIKERLFCVRRIEEYGLYWFQKAFNLCVYIFEFLLQIFLKFTCIIKLIIINIFSSSQLTNNWSNFSIVIRLNARPYWNLIKICWFYGVENLSLILHGKKYFKIRCFSIGFKIKNKLSKTRPIWLFCSLNGLTDIYIIFSTYKTHLNGS